MAEESTNDNLTKDGASSGFELAGATPNREADDADDDASDSDDELGPREDAEGESDDAEAPGEDGLDAEEDEVQAQAPAATTDALEPFRAAIRSALSRPGSERFFRGILSSLARAGVATPALRETLLPLLREYVREGVSEPEAYPELVDLYAEGVDEVLPMITALATRALLRALERRGTPAPEPARMDETVRHAERAARGLTRDRGRRALHALPQALIRAAVPARSRRRLRIPGPVEIVIYAR